MGEVYSHLSEEERQVIQIEVGNGTGIRAIGAMIGRSPSTVSREIKRNTWFPSNESESYRPYRPRRLKTGPWTSRYYIAGPARRKAARRRAVFCQVVIGQCGVSFPSEKAVGFSPVRNWPVIARVLLFHCIRA